MTRSNTGLAPGPGCARPGWARLTPVALRAPYVTRAGEKAPFSPKMGRSGNQEIRNIEVLTIARRRCRVKIEPHPPLISVKQESRLKCQGCVRSRTATKRLYEDLSCSLASASARTPRSASATNARLIVTCCSLAVRRTAETRVAGIVTLWRTDLAAAVLRVAIFKRITACTTVVR